MKKNLLHIVSAISTRRTPVLLAAIIYVGLQLCPSAGKSQVTYWQSSLNSPGARRQVVTTAPASGNDALRLSNQNIPLYMFEDDRNGYIYWSDAGTGSIRKVKITGGTITEVVTGITASGKYPRGIYVDVTNNMLYWGETSSGTADVIKKISIAGSLPKASSAASSIVTGIDIVRGITVDSTTGWLYFIDASSVSKRGIYRVNTTDSVGEASALKVAAPAAGTQPNTLCLDVTNKLLYWSDHSAAGKIQRIATNAATFPATQTNVYTSTASIRGISVDAAKSMIYWTEYPTLAVKKASLATIPLANVTTLITSLAGFPRAVSIRIDTCKTYVTPTVTVTANVPSPICAKTKVTFTATAANAGIPVYEWHKNSAVVGTNSSTYVDSLLNNYDSVWCEITSNYLCAAATKAKSNVLAYNVNPAVTPSVSISATYYSPICAGTSVTFTASANYGGTPIYEWHKNRKIVGTNSYTYTDNTLKTNDTVWCDITSSYPCATPVKVKSNVIVYTVNTCFAGGKQPVNTNGTDGGKVLLSPNPASAASTLSLSGFKSGVIVTVTDMAGHIVWQQNRMANGVYTLPLAKLAQGVYIVTVKDRANVQSLKLVKSPVTQ